MAAASDIISIIVKTMTGQLFAIEIDRSMTPQEIKFYVSEILHREPDTGSSFTFYRYDNVNKQMLKNDDAFDFTTYPIEETDIITATAKYGKVRVISLQDWNRYFKPYILAELYGVDNNINHDLIKLKTEMFLGAIGDNGNIVIDYGNGVFQPALNDINSLKYMKMLLEKGADPTLKGKDGKTILDIINHKLSYLSSHPLRPNPSARDNAIRDEIIKKYAETKKIVESYLFGRARKMRKSSKSRKSPKKARRSPKKSRKVSKSR